MKAGRAFAAGVAGGIVMSIILAMARGMGMPAQLEMLEGTMMLPPGPAAFWLGMMMHLIISGVIGLIYGWGFEAVRRAGWVTGLGFGVIHAIIAGMAMGMMPMIHPRIPPMHAPGWFMSNIGMMGVAAMVMLHLIYGAVVGAIYGPVQHGVIETVRDGR